MADHDAEVDAIVAELEAAGLVTIGTDADGHETWTLTEMGEQLARRAGRRSLAEVEGRRAVRPSTR